MTDHDIEEVLYEMREARERHRRVSANLDSSGTIDLHL